MTSDMKVRLAAQRTDCVTTNGLWGSVAAVLPRPTVAYVQPSIAVSDLEMEGITANPRAWIAQPNQPRLPDPRGLGGGVL